MTDKRLSTLKNHIIVVGFGRLGRQIALELHGEDVPVVIIDREDKSAECDRLGYLFIQGDCALKDEILIRSGIKSAKTIILAMGNDSEVLASAVTARALNGEINIVARANTHQSAERLNRVGVNKVALPAQIGGYHMATMALRPSVVDFLDILIDSAEESMQIEEFPIPADSILINKRIHDYFMPHRNNLSVIAVRRNSHNEFLRPNADTLIHEGDNLILMGTKSELNNFIRHKGE
jgi:voltage-gated potassium channel